MNKSVLLLQLLDLLKTNPAMNASDIARELNRSERTVYRYLQSLSFDLSVPVFYENGYKIAGRPRLSPINFTDEEALALRLALSAAPIRKTEPFNRHLSSAQRKIEAAMSESSLKRTKNAAGKVAISISGYDANSIVPKVLPLIEDAAIKQQSLRLSYRSLESKRPTERIFDPYALVFRKHNWYVIGYCHKRREVIQCKVLRIVSASPAGRTFTTPDSFSVDSFYEGSWEFRQGDPVQVKVRFDASVAPLIEETRRHPSQTIEKLADGSVVMSAELAGFEEFGWWVLSYGGRAEVLEPAEFRAWMAENARRLADLYLREETDGD